MTICFPSAGAAADVVAKAAAPVTVSCDLAWEVTYSGLLLSVVRSVTIGVQCTAVGCAAMDMPPLSLCGGLFGVNADGDTFVGVVVVAFVVHVRFSVLLDDCRLHDSIKDTDGPRLLRSSFCICLEFYLRHLVLLLLQAF